MLKEIIEKRTDTKDLDFVVFNNYFELIITAHLKLHATFDKRVREVHDAKNLASKTMFCAKMLLIRNIVYIYSAYELFKKEFNDPCIEMLRVILETSLSNYLLIYEGKIDFFENQGKLAHDFFKDPVNILDEEKRKKFHETAKSLSSSGTTLRNLAEKLYSNPKSDELKNYIKFVEAILSPSSHASLLGIEFNYYLPKENKKILAIEMTYLLVFSLMSFWEICFDYIENDPINIELKLICKSGLNISENSIMPLPNNPEIEKKLRITYAYLNS
ncbi:MAG: hypothetical protein AABX38_06165 [Candidatus Micrarchaeota archaeon]